MQFLGTLIGYLRTTSNVCVGCRFIDPSDPSTVFLTQPVGEEQRRADMPRYAANYGQEEKYEDMSGPGV